MDELQERAEIDALLAEQLADDTDFQRPEFRDSVTFDAGLDDRIGVNQDGDIELYDSRSLGMVEHGAALVGAAAWHGTVSGYVNHKCKCQPCKDAQAARIRRQRANRKAKESS